ncbi:hypothetical protein [Alistipes finegoldii]|uniref:hypothetical protein n=1 Tax=Alistipes finegoldii TaxID=214856 RepID=UPI00242B5264|nr:hypothetical protein [Alistipes finegoldii]
MTLKSYLRMLLAAVTLLFVTSGCNDDDDKVGPPPSYSFSVAVSDVAQTEATVTVTPSNDQATYYYAAVKKAEFDTFESDAAYAQHILDNLKAIADKKVLPLSEYLATALVKGSAPQKITDLTAGTDYYAVALGMLTDGRFTSDLVKEAFKTDDAPEPALELSITMTPGYNGEGTDTQMSVNFKASGRPAVSGKYLLASTAAIDAVIAKGGSYDDIIDNEENGYAFAAAELVELNSEEGTVGEDWVWGRLTPGTSYTVIAKVKDAEGNSVLKTAVESTAAAQGGGDGPELSIVMTPGLNGANTDTRMTVDLKVSGKPAVAGKYMLNLTSAFEAAIAEGASYDEIIEAYGTEFTAEELTELNSAQGTQGWYWDKRTPETSYTAVAKVYDADGKSTLKYEVKSTTASQGGGDGPELTLTMKAGDPKGENPTTAVTCVIKSSGATAAKAGIWPKSLVDEVLAEGETIESIINNEQLGQSFEGDHLAAINGNGLPLYTDKASPSTEYITIAKVTDAAGNSTIKSATATTESAGEASDAYKAWLGTWTVTSTSSTYTKKPLTFDVVFKQKVANVSYAVEGWTASIFRDQPDKSPYFPVATFNDGGFYFANGQTFGKFNLGEYGTGTLTYCCFFTLAGKNYYSSQTEFSDGTPFVSLYGTMNSDKQSAVVEGAEVEYSDGKATMEYADFMYVLDSGKGAMGVIPGEGFKYSTPEGEDTDSPIGPYTMVKKGSATSALSAPSKSAVDINAMPYVGKLSSVLSVNAAVSVPAKQDAVVVESKVAMSESLVFEPSMIVCKGDDNCNLSVTKKSLGLKKHYRK